MALNVFKGIGQVTWENFSGLTEDQKIGKLWFVKRTVAKGGNDDGYGEIYFGSRHYGHFSQAEINAISANKTAIESINNELTTVKGNVESQGKSIESLQSLIDSIAKYEYKEVEAGNVPSGVMPTEVDDLPAATKDSAEYVKVVKDETTTYYKKEALSFESLQNAIDAIRNEYKIKSVKDDDNVLSVDASGVLSAGLSLKYNSDEKKIYLYGKDGKTAIGDPIDATAFIKDGMLETAEIVEVTEEDGKFVYGSGKTEVTGVSAAGKYIRLHFNTDSKKTDVFLSVSEMVKAYTAGKDVEIKSDDNSINVALDEEITVMGVNVGTLKNKSKLAKGMSLSEILKKILIREIDVKATKPTVSVSITKNPNAATYEVGTSVDVTLGHTYTDGKFTGADDLYSYSQTAGCAEGETTYKRGNTVIAGGKETVTVSEGTYTYNCSTAYAASTNTPKKNNGENSTVNIPAGTCTSENVSFSGRYYGYVGYHSATTVGEITSDIIRGFTTKQFINPTGSTTLVSQAKSDGKSIVIAVPTSYSLKTITNGLGANIIDNFSKTGTVDYSNGSTKTSYNVYIYPITNNAEVEYKNVTVGKQ